MVCSGRWASLRLLPCNRSLPPELIERLEDAVDHGHELTVLLADTVRTTAALHAAS
ncbi:hypothetical protein DWB77_00401 [Streptomyces hundungensis]|uniref:Uncharacterized protein n=1 Tax=Streptomyces hundungensis TaxID=1077946 RepID=A0A387H4J7_9ACTN|nr:hypothetical protein DWB77_00401 [Streptomyces hundungensis]